MKIINVGVFEELNPASTNIQQVNALERMGHVVTKYPYRDQLRNFGPMLATNFLLELANRELPDIIWFNKCNELPPHASKILTEKYLTILWHMDAPTAATMYVREHMVNCDYTICSSKAAALGLKRALNIPVYVVRDGVDFSIHQPYEGPRDRSLECNVSFIGSPDPHRLDMMRAILEVTNKVHIYDLMGITPEHPLTWADTPYGGYLKGPAENEMFSKAIAHSLVNIGTQRNNDRSIRTFWILGCKGFLLNESFMEIEEDFENGVHLVSFEQGNFSEMQRIIKEWITDRQKNARKSIAEAGYKHVLKNFTWEKTFENIFELISGEEERKRFKV